MYTHYIMYNTICIYIHFSFSIYQKKCKPAFRHAVHIECRQNEKERKMYLPHNVPTYLIPYI